MRISRKVAFLGVVIAIWQYVFWLWMSAELRPLEESIVNPWNGHMTEYLSETSKQDSKTITLVFTDLEVNPLVKNLVKQMQEVGILNYMVFSLDVESCKELQITSCFYNESYYALTDREMMLFKVNLWHQILNSGLDLLFLASDTLLLNNPLLHFNYQADMNVMRLSYRIQPTKTEQYVPLNDEFFFMRSSLRSIQMIERVMTIIEAESTEKEHLTLHHAFGEAAATTEGFVVSELSHSLYPNGFTYFFAALPQRRGVAPTAVQNHLLHDEDIAWKIYRAREMQAWLLDPPERYTLAGRRFLTYRTQTNDITIAQERDMLMSFLLLAKVLGRQLILPKFHCFRGEKPTCHADAIFDSRQLQHLAAVDLPLLEHSFLSHPTVSKALGLKKDAIEVAYHVLQGDVPRHMLRFHSFFLQRKASLLEVVVTNNSTSFPIEKHALPLQVMFDLKQRANIKSWVWHIENSVQVHQNIPTSEHFHLNESSLVNVTESTHVCAIASLVKHGAAPVVKLLNQRRLYLVTSQPAVPVPVSYEVVLRREVHSSGSEMDIGFDRITFGFNNSDLRMLEGHQMISHLQTMECAKCAQVFLYSEQPQWLIEELCNNIRSTSMSPCVHIDDPFSPHPLDIGQECVSRALAKTLAVSELEAALGHSILLPPGEFLPLGPYFAHAADGVITIDGCQGNASYSTHWVNLLEDPTKEIQFEKYTSPAVTKEEVTWAKCEKGGGPPDLNAVVHLKAKPKAAERARALYQQLVKEKRPPPSRSPDSPPMNVLIIQVDSVSRGQWLRALNKTTEALRNINKGKSSTMFEMIGLHIMGLNSLPNKAPLVSGHDVWKFVYQSRAEDRKVYPSYLWTEYQRRGYVTMHGEELCFDDKWRNSPLGFFNHSDPPVDHVFPSNQLICNSYMQPFSESLNCGKYNASYSFTGVGAVWNTPLCTGHRPLADYSLDYVLQFFEQYTNVGKFGSMMIHEGHEASYSLLNKIDHVMTNFLKKFERFLDNTLLVMLADHGLHFGQMANTMLSQEHRNPALFLSVPNWFLSRFPQLYTRLHDLQTQLVTPLDIYHTLKHLAHYPNTPSSIYTDKPISSISFIGDSVLPKGRTCADALIPTYVCGCYEWKPVAKDKIMNLIDIPIAQMNQHINESLAVCHPIELLKMVRAEETKEKDQIMYLFEFTVVPPSSRSEDPPLFRSFLTHSLVSNNMNLDYIIQVSEYAKYFSDECSRGLKGVSEHFCLCKV